MKKIFSFVICALLLASCNDNKGYVINGTVEEANLNGKNVYLYQYGVNDAEPTANALVENGAFSFEGIQEIPKLYTLRFDENDVPAQRVAGGQNAPFAATFVLENGKLKVNLGEVSTVTGTPENDALTSLQKELVEYRNPLKDLIEKMQSGDATIAADAEQKYEEIDVKITESVKNYINNNPDKLTAGKLLYDFRHSLDETTRRDIISKAGNTFKSAPGVDKIIDHLNTLDKVAIGKKFTDFEMADPNGKMHKLSDYAGKGNVVLVDFWASWCPPCRKDMPHLVELYNQNNRKNFEIVGVSLDRNNEDWVKGIKDLNITWPQMSDLKFWQSEGAALYGVNSIPHTVLIDGDGTIIAKNLRGEELDRKLAEILK